MVNYLLFELFYKYLKEQGVDDKAVRYILTNRVYIGEYNHYGERKIIDTFINAIYVSDDDFKIVYNVNGKQETIKLEELESSTLFSNSAPKESDSNRRV